MKRFIQTQCEKSDEECCSGFKLSDGLSLSKGRARSCHKARIPSRYSRRKSCVEPYEPVCNSLLDDALDRKSPICALSAQSQTFGHQWKRRKQDENKCYGREGKTALKVASTPGCPRYLDRLGCTFGRGRNIRFEEARDSTSDRGLRKWDENLWDYSFRSGLDSWNIAHECAR